VEKFPQPILFLMLSLKIEFLLIKFGLSYIFFSQKEAFTYGKNS